jgi:hypothetical protein
MTVEVKEARKRVRVLVGCNWPDPKGKGELRAEAGQSRDHADFKPSSLKALKDMGAIEEEV